MRADSASSARALWADASWIRDVLALSAAVRAASNSALAPEASSRACWCLLFSLMSSSRANCSCSSALSARIWAFSASALTSDAWTCNEAFTSVSSRICSCSASSLSFLRALDADSGTTTVGEATSML